MCLDFYNENRKSSLKFLFRRHKYKKKSANIFKKIAFYFIFMKLINRLKFIKIICTQKIIKIISISNNIFY